jgi:5-hydroxyisourate hydrolase
MSAQTTISTHVLDTSLGTPAGGVMVILEHVEADGTSTRISRDHTNSDGRVSGLTPAGPTMKPGTYRLTFDVAAYFASSRRKAFYRTIHIDFEVGVEPQHYHVPLLLNPFGYSTYRGS